MKSPDKVISSSIGCPNNHFPNVVFLNIMQNKITHFLYYKCLRVIELKKKKNHYLNA